MHQPAIGISSLRARRQRPPSQVQIEQSIGDNSPTTTATNYDVEGCGSRNYLFVKKMLHQAPTLWTRLLDKLTEQLPRKV